MPLEGGGTVLFGGVAGRGRCTGVTTGWVLFGGVTGRGGYPGVTIEGGGAVL